MKQEKSEINSALKSEPPDLGSIERVGRLEEVAKMQIEEEEKSNKEDKQQAKSRSKPLVLLYGEGKKITSSVRSQDYLKSTFLIFNFLFFRLFQTETRPNFRHRRRPSVRFFLLLIILYKLYSLRQNYAQSSQVEHNFEPSLDKQQQPQQEQPRAAFFESPQPLVYLHESGSGEGQFPQQGSNFKLSSINQVDSSSSSSSVSPSLITAKCWNNYEDDNDCKQINVITANNDQQQQQQYEQNNNDDSLITSVVIFESSSTLEPLSSSSPKQQGSQHFLAPPYFSSTFGPDSDNVVLAGRPTPATANDVYAAPPAGSTILPDFTQQQQTNLWSSRGQTSKDQVQQRNKQPTRDGADESVTMPGTSVFVATPQPKKATKTTTIGRKCRDENDEDCDEPTEEEDNNKSSQQSNRNNNNNINADDESSNRYNTREDGNDISDSDDSPDDGDGDGIDNNKTGTYSSETSNEIGSGSGPNDDSEDDDDDSNQVEESSGSSEPSLHNQTPKFVQVTTTSQSWSSTDNQEQSSSSRVKPGAEIEVVVHPTLPPTFPITTTLGATNYDSPDIYSTKNEPQTSTFMIDDTYTSKPVFPSSTPNDPEEDSSKMDEDGSTTVAGGTSTEFDLATFKPIPMPPVENERWPNPGVDFYNPRNNHSAAGTNSATSTSGPASNNQEAVQDNNKLQDRHKFDPSSAGANAAPIKFDNPWRAQPVQRPSLNQIEQQRPLARRPEAPARASTNEMVPVNQARMQSDILPTMLLYASIVILFVTALIFVIMAFAVWRRNTARRRALLLKSQQQVLNGAGGAHLGGPGGGPNQVAGNQLMANIQQPGLLSTYGPGKGLTMGKVSSSIMRDNDGDNMIGEEDETNPMLAFDQQKPDVADQLNNGHNNNPRADRNQQARASGATGNGATSSWSTDQDQTTTSSGSQKTELGQQSNLVAGQSRPQYPNSLSDGRQNSSSISDSQCSPDELRQQAPAQYQPDVNYQAQAQAQQMQQNQGGPVFLNGHNQTIAGASSSSSRGPAMYNQTHAVIPNSVKQQQQNKQHQFNSSRSFENLAQHDGYRLEAVGGEQVQLHPNQPPYMGQQQQQQQQQVAHMINHQMIQQAPVQTGLLFKPMAPPPQQTAAQRAFLSNSPARNGSIEGSYPNPSPSQHINGALRLTNGNTPPIQFNQPGGPFNSDFAHFSAQSTVNPARVAMNPLATLGRRYPVGMGLNRNIYSEDSSSLMTASPSLARTSSSLSFAFSASNQPTPSSIRAKPLVDAAGRVFNDYTQVSYNSTGNNNTGTGAPPVLGRKDRSEAWYV